MWAAIPLSWSPRRGWVRLKRQAQTQEMRMRARVQEAGPCRDNE